MGHGARRFVVQVAPGDVRTFTWADAPPALACDVLERVIDLDDADDRRRVALAALRGGLFERAQGHLDAARALDVDLALPDPAPLVPLARLFRGAGEVGADGVALTYEFEREDELRDLRALAYSEARLDGGDLVLASGLLALAALTGEDLPPEAAVGFASLRGRWRGLELELALATPKADLLLGLSGAVVAVGPGGAGWGTWSELATLRTKGRLAPGVPLRVGLWPVDEGRVRVVVKQGAEGLLEAVVPSPSPLELVLGARGGPVRVQRLALRGALDPAWLEVERERVPFLLEVELDRWRRRVEAEAREQGALPPHLDVTSAEDEAALAGVPRSARQLLAQARARLRAGDQAGAEELTRRAVAEGRGRYWAAEYLLAQLELDRGGRHAASLEGPRIRLDHALAAIDDFFEALAARSRVHLEAGRLDEARRDADAAIALRPDHAPARLARAWVALQEGQLDLAVDEARLAATLADGLGDALEQLEALRDGPPWNDPVTRETVGYRVTTDMPARLDAFLAALEATRAALPRVFPCLRARPGAPVRVGRVLLFSRAEDYHRFAWRTTGDRKESTAGYFSPRAGVLHIYDSPEGPEQTLRVLRHEATHQWVHALGLELPYWANEAIADYLGGYDPSTGKSRPDPQQVRALVEGKDRLRSLFDLMTLSPTEFYSGDVYLQYAQAWSFVHHCMEGDDPLLKAALFAYLAKHGEGQAGDRSRQAGVSLEHIYAATFHQLDMAKVERAWWAHVERMARESP
ncbi:MAG: hypothetical protein M9894_08820 [Planctomycetes bacterium]|nr:hypothetical protein [Planctomycetota bacterium]